MAIFMDSVLEEYKFDVDETKDQKQFASHGKAICDGGAGKHREGGCLVTQPTNDPPGHPKSDPKDSSSASESTRPTVTNTSVPKAPTISESTYQHTVSPPPTTTQLKNPGAQNNTKAVNLPCKTSNRVESSTSGFFSNTKSLLKEPGEEDKNDGAISTEEPSHAVTPQSSFQDPKEDKILAHGVVQLLDSKQESSPLYNLNDMHAIELERYRREGTTMPSVIKFFPTPDPADPGG